MADPLQSKQLDMKELAWVVTFLIIIAACIEPTPESESSPITEESSLKIAADRMDEYLPYLENKAVALVVNHTSRVGDTHLVDTLLNSGVQVKKVFAPEHGFRGSAGAGEKIQHSTDSLTGLPIVSLYGSSRKPSEEHLSDVDLVLFDIQDVGVRFYTYISTMHYVMEACGIYGKQMLVLDRPNPNGDYVDGPILEEEQRSFVGMHPIPIVHGLTVGELANMIKGEHWLSDSATVDLKIIPMENYHHAMKYDPPVKPSPNLPNFQSIRLYPSLCLFEGSDISIGRGTEFPFQVVGHPLFSDSSFSFTPVSMEGKALNPKHQDQLCGGWDLRSITPPKFTLSYLIRAYKEFPEREEFFKDYFHLLAGNSLLMEQVQEGMTEEEIRATWNEGLKNYREIRQRYLLYPESNL